MADRSARILLADDEQSIQTLLSYPLRKEGYEVVQATDGREALDRFAEQPFDLVVLDVMLPQLDGLEVCRRLRARSAVPIIMLTAKSEEIDKVRRAGAGRRRLHHQAVLDARVPLAHQGGAAAGRHAAPQAPSRTSRRWRSGDLTSTSASASVEVRGGDVPPDVRGVRDPRRPGPQPGTRVHPRPAPRRASGATPPSATRARSTSTSATCARSSSSGPSRARVHLHGARRRLPVPRQAGGGRRLSRALDPQSGWRCCSSRSC